MYMVLDNQLEKAISSQFQKLAETLWELEESGICCEILAPRNVRDALCVKSHNNGTDRHERGKKSHESSTLAENYRQLNNADKYTGFLYDNNFLMKILCTGTEW